MVKRSSVLWVPLTLSFFATLNNANATINTASNPFYVGLSGGYGSTTWFGLVPDEENKNLALSISTPDEVHEGGNVWGVFIGHEFTPNFALEASYKHYPDARITFDPMSLFSFMNDDKTELRTQSEVLALIAKLMVTIPETNMRAYSSAGLARVHRSDMIVDAWRYSPTFGLGLNYHFSEHLMAGLGGDYTAGYGESQLNPADAYFPFLYSASVSIAYCF